jgi:hypothetical protein
VLNNNKNKNDGIIPLEKIYLKNILVRVLVFIG